MLKRGTIAFVVAVVVGATTAATLQRVLMLRFGASRDLAGPVSQAIAMWAAWTIAYPIYYRYNPKSLWFPSAFGNSVFMAVIVTIIAAVRIALHLG
jgi:hypothetical protein